MDNPAKGRFRPGIGLVIVLLHAIAITAVFIIQDVSGMALVVAGILYAISSLGITVGYHRYFTHGAFQCGEGVKYVLAFAGALAAEGPLDKWCSDHRQHHRFTDGEYDPHSPYAYRQPLGFLWAHVGWLFWETARPDSYHPSTPAQDEAVVAWQARWYWYIVVLGFLIPALLAGWTGLLLAGFIRIVAHLHVTWMVNSVCHMWGARPMGLDGVVWKNDKSRNNLLVAMLSMGEGWHGNHHVKPNSAELGYRWYQWDPGKWLINVMELVRLVLDVRRFSRA